MKTLLTIMLLTFAVSMTAQDTLRYESIDHLSKQISDMQYNLGEYAAKRKQAFAYGIGSVATYAAVTAINLNADEPYGELYAVPLVFSVVAVVKFFTAERWLRKIEVTGSGVKIKF